MTPGVKRDPFLLVAVARAERAKEAACTCSRGSCLLHEAQEKLFGKDAGFSPFDCAEPPAPSGDSLDFAKPAPGGVVEIGMGYAVDLGEGSSTFGWMLRPGPEPKQWITMRKADAREIEHARALQAKPPCVTCAGTGMLDSGDVEIGARPCDACGGRTDPVKIGDGYEADNRDDHGTTPEEQAPAAREFISREGCR
jgi:hypothetical protein